MFEIFVGCKQRKIVVDAKLGQQGVDRSDLYPGAPAAISQLCGCDVIISVRH